MVSRVVSVKRSQTDVNETSHSFWLCATLTNALTTICNEAWTGNTGHTHWVMSASKRWFTADEEIGNSASAYVFCTNIFRNICIYVAQEAVMTPIHNMICSEFFLRREFCRAFICEDNSFIFDIRKDWICQTQCGSHMLLAFISTACISELKNSLLKEIFASLFTNSYSSKWFCRIHVRQAYASTLLLWGVSVTSSSWLRIVITVQPLIWGAP